MSVFRRFFDRLRGRSTEHPAEGTSPSSSTNNESSRPVSATSGSSSASPALPVAADPDFAPTAPAKLLKGSKGFSLDAGPYQPISREELKSAAKGQGLLLNTWFRRRELIPPADDQRTALIDRALVTHRLLSPEQLLEIHATGAEMDLVRPSLAASEHRASKQGEAAVLADRAAKAEIKAGRKAESAKRAEKKAQTIADRKAFDIVFLGRGVSGRLGDRTSRIDALHAAGLPVLNTPMDLARVLDLSIPRLRWLAFHTEVASRIHYVQFSVPKKSGGTRTLSAPHRILGESQRWVFEEIISKLPAENAAHGFLSGRSILTNAQRHSGRAVVVNLDLEGFFPSIGFRRVRSVFARLGYSPAVSTILALLCTECPREKVVYDGTPYFVATGPRGLPQGACTSPGLSNQVARRLDRRLAGLASKLGIAYTRYADDLTFSGEAELEPRIGYVLARVCHIAENEGFTVNEAKTRVQRRNTAQTVTGLVVNDTPGVCRRDVRRLRAILHRARHEGLERQNRDGRPDFLAWLRGKIAYVAMARPDVGHKLQRELDILTGRT
jgi:RNA-directed DNA polymerase